MFLANEFPEMSELKKLVVEYTGSTKYDLQPVTSLIWACPRLEEFRVEVGEFTYSLYSYMRIGSNINQSYGENV